jgi:hypothetical protein
MRRRFRLCPAELANPALVWTKGGDTPIRWQAWQGASTAVSVTSTMRRIGHRRGEKRPNRLSSAKAARSTSGEIKKNPIIEAGRPPFPLPWIF